MAKDSVNDAGSRIYIWMNEELLKDTEHWQSLKPPLSPNEDEIRIYEEQCKGSGPICLLGMTKELIHICDYMVDMTPIPQKKPVIKSNWKDFGGLAGTVIGDGVLNLAGPDLVEKLLKKCDRLVCRVFTRKLEGMKYATHFPNSFPGAKKTIQTQQDVVMVIWDS